MELLYCDGNTQIVLYSTCGKIFNFLDFFSGDVLKIKRTNEYLNRFSKIYSLFNLPYRFIFL